MVKALVSCVFGRLLAEGRAEQGDLVGKRLRHMARQRSLECCQRRMPSQVWAGACCLNTYRRPATPTLAAFWRRSSMSLVLLTGLSMSCRFAPLSVGRVQDGQLFCRYHGWGFEGSQEGRCISNPQADGPKAEMTTMQSSRSCLKTYPSQVSHFCGEMPPVLDAAKRSGGIAKIQL